MNQIEKNFDLVVVGGGMSGVCAALAAARHGAKTALVHERPVLGGNASSEFRMHICGADRHGSRPNLRETGILEELLLEVKRRNANPDFWMLDIVLWEKCRAEENLTLFLNAHADKAAMRNGRIAALNVIQLGSETVYTLTAPLFLDATGDGTLSAQAGADWVYGRESRETYGEHWAPEQADSVVEGSSLMFTAKDMGYPVPFETPSWAYRFTEDDLKNRDHSEITSGYWWIELGGDQMNTITDNEAIRDELLRTLFGVWGHIKQEGHGAENYALNWISPVVGKRESRRVLGDYVLREQDLLAERVFEDAVAYGGWSMDCHVPGGIRAATLEPTQYLGNFNAYTIPYRCLYSRNVPNLMLTGRIISCSHMAFSSSRVMATCALTGQAAGTAAALCIRQGVDPRSVDVAALQRMLMRDDCWIPGYADIDPGDAAQDGVAYASVNSEDARSVQNGVYRFIGQETNAWTVPACGEPWLAIQLARPEEISELVLRFDSNLSREIMPTISDRIRARQAPGTPPELIRDYRVELMLGDRVVQNIDVRGNGQRVNRHSLNHCRCDRIVIYPQSTNGADFYRIFAVNAYRD